MQAIGPAHQAHESQKFQTAPCDSLIGPLRRVVSRERSSEAIHDTSVTLPNL